MIMKKLIRIISLTALVGCISIFAIAKIQDEKQQQNSSSVKDQSNANSNAPKKEAFTSKALISKDSTSSLSGIVVSTTTAIAKPWQQHIDATGTLAAFQGIVLKSEIQGRIAQIFFKSGQDVKQGDPLIQLNPTILQAQVAQDHAHAAFAHRQYQRYKSLYEERAVTKADYDTAKTTMNADQAVLNQAEAQLKQSLIIAPFSGRLGLRQVSIGDFVTRGQTLVNLQALDPLVVNFSLPETYLNKLSVGNSVIIHFDAFPNQTFTGKIYAFDSLIDPSTRNISIRASIANPDKKLLPGAYVQIEVLAGKSESLTEIPQSAIVSDISGTYVYRVINGRAIKTTIVVAARENENAIIQSGIKVGDEVITNGQTKINRDNAPVIIGRNP